jgi:hypothetical protein
MREHRSGCPINLATEVLGDKWSLVDLRDLMFGDRRLLHPGPAHAGRLQGTFCLPPP